jgi:hypothetical protein
MVTGPELAEVLNETVGKYRVEDLGGGVGDVGG